MTSMSHSNGFALPALPNTSSSSLLDAVVGGKPAAAAAPHLGRLAEEPLGDASARVNHRAGNGLANGGQQSEADVAELERKLEKRRSLIPHLESELAALEAQIKEAEARLSRVQATGSPTKS
ncbi:hypothetical protein Q8F55_001183 [Vanrija albida]|uniref:Mediator of RNA polymerase II transcription subunit 9 n=1 Tax=Vanrija albida TaxID=181172 RepID=A0ABR3QFU1_9TREE